MGRVACELAVAVEGRGRHVEVVKVVDNLVRRVVRGVCVRQDRRSRCLFVVDGWSSLFVDVVVEIHGGGDLCWWQDGGLIYECGFGGFPEDPVPREGAGIFGMPRERWHPAGEGHFDGVR